MFTVVSGYTQNTPYEQEVDTLVSSLRKFDISFKLYPYASQGNWIRNTQYKATIIKQALEDVSDCIWLDADAVVNHYPTFFDQIETQDFDICCYYLDTKYRKHELLSGTFVFRDTPATARLVDDWIKAMTSWGSYDMMDQRVLQRLVESRSLKVLPLPVEYIKINPVNGKLEDLKDQIIVHRQVSRLYRNS
jgi:hypothetical protein